MRWLCECDRTNAVTSAECWSCGRPRPTTSDDVVASLKDALTAATARAERADVLVAWARSRIAECRRQEAKFGAGDVAIEASTERRALQAVLSMLGRDEG